MDAKKLLVDKAKELAALATARGVRLPAGTDGLGRAANALNTTKNGAEFDLVRLETRCVASALLARSPCSCIVTPTGRGAEGARQAVRRR